MNGYNKGWSGYASSDDDGGGDVTDDSTGPTGADTGEGIEGQGSGGGAASLLSSEW